MLEEVDRALSIISRDIKALNDLGAAITNARKLIDHGATHKVIAATARMEHARADNLQAESNLLFKTCQRQDGTIDRLVRELNASQRRLRKAEKALAYGEHK